MRTALDAMAVADNVTVTRAVADADAVALFGLSAPGCSRA